MTSVELCARQAAERMRDKYTAMIELRLRAPSVSAPKGALRALSRRYPGALRELDQRPLREIETRLVALERCIVAGEAVPAWVLCQDRFHGFLRAALRLRARLKSGWVPSIAQFDRQPGEPHFAEWSEPWQAAVVRPPGGRLTPVALAFVSQAMGRSTSEIERLIFS